MNEALERVVHDMIEDGVPEEEALEFVQRDGDDPPHEERAKAMVERQSSRMTNEPGRHCLAHMQILKEAGDPDRRTIIGVANTARKDRTGQEVDQESLGEAAREFMSENRNLFLNHNWREDLGIGRVLGMRPTKKRLYARAQVGRDFEVAVGFGVKMHIDDIWKRIQQGILNSFSISFLGDLISKGSREILTVRDLLELSIVTIPASRGAQFNVAKAIADGTDLWTPRADARPGDDVGESDELDEAKILAALDGFKMDDSSEASSVIEGVEKWIEQIRF